MLTITLKDIREHQPCVPGWEKLLAYLGKTRADDKTLPLETILESNGIKDAIWALRAVDEKYDNAVRLFNCKCARYVLDIFEKKYPEDQRPRKAIEASEKYAHGLIGEEELDSAWHTSWGAKTAAKAAAKSAAWAAAEAASCAFAAADCQAAAGASSWAATVAASWAATEAAAWAATEAPSWAATEAASWAAAEAGAKAAAEAAWSFFENELIRLCRLEGEYGEVVQEGGASHA